MSFIFKLALSVLQTKAETEISNAHKLISDKGAELHAAEEVLSGLEEVLSPAILLVDFRV